MVPKLALVPNHGAPLNAAATELAGAFGVAPHSLLSAASLPFALLGILIGVICIVCGLAASRLRARLAAFRRTVPKGRPGKDQSLYFRDALLNNSRQAVVILETDIAFGEGSKLLRQAMTGPDGIEVSKALDALQETGRSFELSARAADKRIIAVRGAPIGHRAVLYLEDKDMTEVSKMEAKLQRAMETQLDMLERFPQAIAIFDASQRLTGHNSNYARLWGFSEAWLDTHPLHAEILGRLRETRRLPEQRDFAAWNQSQLQMFAHRNQRSEEIWHLPDGKSLRFITQPHLGGGIFVLFEDISDQLRLETSLNLLTRVQKATLDTLDEGIAIFGMDGRLVLHNAHFAKLWHLTEEELSGHPHFTDIADSCDTRIGQDTIWGIVSAGVGSLEPERHGKWGKARRADGRIISLSLSRLPNAATIVTFMDLTDLERFEIQQREAYQDPASADAKASRKS